MSSIAAAPTASAGTRRVLADVIARPSSRARAFALDAGLVIAGATIVALLAQVEIPLWPVPITGQTLGVIVVGAALGAWRGAAALTTYMLVGLAGLPVFAGGGGLAYMAGPTGGYLLGFLLAAVALGWLAERGWARSVPSTLAAMLVGTAIIFACGIAWLGTLIGLRGAIGAGLVPFLLSEAVKIALATALVPFGWRLLQRR